MQSNSKRAARYKENQFYITMDPAEAQINQIIQQSLELGANSYIEHESITQQMAQEPNDPISANGNGNGNGSDNGNMREIETEAEAEAADADDSASIEVFNTALHQYLRIDEEIKSLMLAVKERNDIKRKLGDTLSNYLKAKQIKKVNLDGSYKGKRLEVEVKTTASGFNKQSITEVLMNELQEETELFDKIMCAISKTNVLKEVWKLKVTEEKAARAASSTGGGAGSKKKGKARQLGNSLAAAAALIDD